MEAMKKRAFIFDTNRCVGCMACVVGCSIENGTELPINWRTVNSHNLIKHPDLPVFHFSLACNHCEEALCMKHCPSLAYTKDELTGAIIHQAEACIGCTYCTWACPYDAPQFNPRTKIVEKCNFCIDRISDGLKTACAEACPVNALDFAWEEDIDESAYLTPGFVNVGIKPSIQLIPLRNETTQPKIQNIDAVSISSEKALSYIEKPESKVELKKEWPLVLFTLAVSVLLAWFASSLSSGTEISLVGFLALAGAAIVLSAFHIGKKMRMWRFMLNLRHSWLSREIVSFSAFVGFAALSIMFDLRLMGYLAIAFGVVTLVSVDMLYQFFIRDEKLKIHSSQLILTAPFLWAYLSGYWELLGVFISLKIALYLYRKLSTFKKQFCLRILISILRLCLLCSPILLYWFNFDFISNQYFNVFLSFFLIGEAIDRLEFYYDSDIKTPKAELREESIHQLKQS